MFSGDTDDPLVLVASIRHDGAGQENGNAVAALVDQSGLEIVYRVIGGPELDDRR